MSDYYKLPRWAFIYMSASYYKERGVSAWYKDSTWCEIQLGFCSSWYFGHNRRLHLTENTKQQTLVWFDARPRFLWVFVCLQSLATRMVGCWSSVCLSQAGEAGEATAGPAVVSSPWPRLMEEGQAEWLLEADTPGWEADSFPTSSKSGDSGCAGLSSSARTTRAWWWLFNGKDSKPMQWFGIFSIAMQCSLSSWKHETREKFENYEFDRLSLGELMS